MDSSTHKLYHIDGMHSRNHLDSFFSGKEDMVFGDDCLKFPMANLHYCLISDHIRGNLLIDASLGSIVHHLYSVSEFFKEIAILKFNEQCIMEVSRWLHNCTGAFDWKHASGFVAGLEGKSDQHEDIEMRLKSSMKQVLKCNFEQENITSPVELPLADCVVSCFLLDAISKNEEEYMKNMEKIVKLLKPGGHLLLLSVINKTYMTVGGERFNFLKHDESLVRNSLDKLGLAIDYFSWQKRRNVSDLTNYKAVMFIAAHKGE
ncbi:nicotinamide N-methyltransferase-like [Rana temporaria]|uniref:nicotinamide N-methyltransferase-like n=1 Tax=Rana temporaria TaxID=8407 RepID=UPI001AACACDE|nr:nicotinamide N-methyltransferase-like [Rana temporaria]